MIIFKHASDLKNYLNKTKRSGKACGFVPTMGALHKGHLSLVKISKAQTDITIVSIFVNPFQFNNPGDLELYPHTLEKDIFLLDEVVADVLFLPNQKEMYPDDSISEKMYELDGMDSVLEGSFRPGHFQGVCRAVHRLLDIVEPDKLYLGQKDYQQVLVIQKLVEQIGSSVEIVIVPTQREKSGLAMSSRNLRLTPDEKQAASSIYKELTEIKEKRSYHHFKQLKEDAIQRLEKAGLTVEYLELATVDELRVLNDFDPGTDMVLLLAAYAGTVRLIDNLLL